MTLTREDFAFLSDLAPDFDASKAYSEWNLAVFGSKLKRCSSAGIGEAATFVDACLEDVLEAMAARIVSEGGVGISDIANDFDTRVAYVENDLVKKDGVLQRCVSAGTGAGAQFVPATVGEVINRINRILADKVSSKAMEEEDEIPEWPSQDEIAKAVKKMYAAMGGSVVYNEEEQ